MAATAGPATTLASPSRVDRGSDRRLLGVALHDRAVWARPSGRSRSWSVAWRSPPEAATPAHPVRASRAGGRAEFKSLGLAECRGHRPDLNFDGQCPKNRRLTHRLEPGPAPISWIAHHFASWPIGRHR